MLDDPDTISAVYRAAKNEALSSEKYNKAVLALRDFLICNRLRAVLQ
jgi:hypothetical protein